MPACGSIEGWALTLFCDSDISFRVCGRTLSAGSLLGGRSWDARICWRGQGEVS